MSRRRFKQDQGTQSHITRKDKTVGNKAQYDLYIKINKNKTHGELISKLNLLISIESNSLEKDALFTLLATY
jgi:ribosome assembly protein YihI (activator of Der GTPase)